MAFLREGNLNPLEFPQLSHLNTQVWAKRHHGRKGHSLRTPARRAVTGPVCSSGNNAEKTEGLSLFFL